MIPAVAAVLLLIPIAATAARADENELWFRNAERRDLARALRARGYQCQDVQAGFQVGRRPDGNHIRLVCGAKGSESDDGATFRLVARGSGIARLEPWNDLVFAGYGLKPSLE